MGAKELISVVYLWAQGTDYEQIAHEAGVSYRHVCDLGTQLRDCLQDYLQNYCDTRQVGGVDVVCVRTNKKELLRVSSNMIDGLWGPLKEFFHQHRGVPHQRYPLLAAEFEWRHNAQGSDLFLDLIRIFKIVY